LLNELLQHSRQAIVLLNTDAVIIFSSESMTMITGYDKKDLAGHSIFDFFDTADITPARKQYEYLTRANRNFLASFVRIRNKSGQLIWIDVVVKNLLCVPGINAVFVLLKNSCDAGTEERKLVQSMTAAKEQEREFIACELHDNVNQIISATKLLVEGALISNNKDELLKLCSANLQFVIDEIRNLSHSMAGYHLHQHGLAFAVDAFIGNMSKTSSLKFETNLQPDALIVLTADQQLQVYRIIQEAISNILRHAAATLAEIILTRHDQLNYLVIKDDGNGFSMNKSKQGIGLSSITNRVKILKGHFHVRTSEGKGSILEIQFPM
jgi:PAS domain S-box-containing protein